jgi:hypothetical protein
MKNPYKAAICGILAIIMVFLLTACPKEQETAKTRTEREIIEGAGFDTPEGAVLEYLDALSNADVARMMSVFAIESYSHDFKAALSQTGTFSTWTAPLPNANDFVKAMNIENRRNKAATSVFRQNRNLRMSDLDSLPSSLLWESGPGIREAVKLNRDKTEISTLVASVKQYLSSLPLATLKVLGFIPLEALNDYVPEGSRKYWENEFDTRGAQIRAGKLTGCVALFELGENKYLFCPDVVNYEGKWYIEQLNGSIVSSLFSDMDMTALKKSEGILPLPNELYLDYFAMLVPIITEPNLPGIRKSGSGKAEGEGFDSSEEAVTAYLDAFKDADFERMISAFAIESFVKNIDIESYLYNFGYFQPWGPIFLDDSDFEQAMNVEWRRNWVAESISAKYRHLCLCDPDSLPDPNYLAPSGDALYAKLEVGKNKREVSTFTKWISKYLTALPLNTLKLHGFIPRKSLEESLLSKSDLETIEKEENSRAERIGAGSLFGCVALFELDGDLFLFTPDTVCYEGKWFICSLGGDTSRKLLGNLGFSIDEYVSGGIIHLANENIYNYLFGLINLDSF